MEEKIDHIVAVVLSWWYLGTISSVGDVFVRQVLCKHIFYLSSSIIVEDTEGIQIIRSTSKTFICFSF